VITTAVHFVLEMVSALYILGLMDDKLTPADPSDVPGAIAFGLRFNRRNRLHEGDKLHCRRAVAVNRTSRRWGRAGFGSQDDSDLWGYLIGPNAVLIHSAI
jgi:hypothetical protein